MVILFIFLKGDMYKWNEKLGEGIFYGKMGVLIFVMKGLIFEFFYLFRCLFLFFSKFSVGKNMMIKVIKKDY